MDIVVIAHRVPYPADKGEKIRTFHQLSYLVSQGHTIKVFAPAESTTDVEFARQLAAKLSIRVYTAPLLPAWWRKVRALLTGQAISASHFYSQALQQLITQSLQQQAPDAILATSSAVAVYAEKAIQPLAVTSRPRLLMDFMDLDSDKWHQYSATARWPMNRVYRREARLVAKLEQQIYHTFDQSFFISANEVSLFSRQLAETSKVAVLANGLDTQTFYPGSVRDPQQVSAAPVFLFTGVMDYLPNEDAVLWFVEAMWPQIRQMYPAATFYIAGMNPSKRIQQLAKQPGVLVTGYVEDILPYYHQADIFVGPFRLARGVQNKILQAMACSLPIVTTPLGAEGIACEDGQHLLLASDPAQFVAAITRLLAEPALRQQLSATALHLIQQHYSWQGVLAPLAASLTAQQGQP
ncbi:MAG: TIGR03087 family PEP-CTERM/XrtA system glycosyltransferase [Alishewanella agri]|nr:TIGR03087 family PEP-CTERM/XrtA system glycosyltransferase [Alishewanella agri]